MHFQSPDANSGEQARKPFNDKDKSPESTRRNSVHSTHEQQVRIRAHEIYRRSRLMDTLPAKGKGVGLLLILLLAVFFATAAANPAAGQVQLPTVNLGDTNFEDGFGAPGWLLEEFPSGYTAGELKDSKGQTVPGSSRVTTYSTTSHIVFASRKRFLRGWIAGEVLLPLVDVDVQLANGTESRVRGFADLTVGAGLQWAPKKIGNGVFVNRAMIDVGVPTGKYTASRPVNLGNHFVVVDPYYAFTYSAKRWS
jgi:hypothetical protein